MDADTLARIGRIEQALERIERGQMRQEMAVFNLLGAQFRSACIAALQKGLQAIGYLTDDDVERISKVADAVKTLLAEQRSVEDCDA